jgi:electron transfer flavoprotein alpha subunit
VAPRVAALLDVMQISDILSVEGPKTFTRPIYAGNAIATVESGDAKLVITVRGTALPRRRRRRQRGIEAVGGAADAGTSSFVGSEIAKSERPELTSAKIIVSGGRALKDAATFEQVIVPLADKLGAGVARAPRWTRAMCPTTTRWARRARSSPPKSTSPWHLRRHPAPGRHEGSKTIIAINKDEDAPSSRSPISASWATSFPSSRS